MALPFIISVPHCADRIPEDIRSTMALSDRQILESVDFGTSEIFGCIPALELVMAQWNRLVVDPNRDPGRLDPKGVIAMTDYHGRPVFRPGLAPDRESTIARVQRYHRPYHAALEKALHNKDALGLIDGHSLNGTGPADAPDSGCKRKDVVLSNNGDRKARPSSASQMPTCSWEQIDLFKAAFEQQGFSVDLNFPYRGGYIVKHYGALLRCTDRFAIQIELNQDLYMDPGDLTPDAGRVQQISRLVCTALQEAAAALIVMQEQSADQRRQHDPIRRIT